MLHNVRGFAGFLVGFIDAKPDGDSIPSMALQPFLGPGLPQKTPPFFSVFCSSPSSSYSYDLCRDSAGLYFRTSFVRFILF